LTADTVGVTHEPAHTDTTAELAADTVGVNDRTEPSRESAPSSLVTDARGCAAAIGISYDQFRRLCGERAWRRGEIPPPVAVGRGSGTADRFGERRGTRRWRLSTIEAWLDAHEWKPLP
jgi:hypothetical protein